MASGVRETCAGALGQPSASERCPIFVRFVGSLSHSLMACRKALCSAFKLAGTKAFGLVGNAET